MNHQLETESDWYTPMLDSIGNYNDKLPNIIHISGIKCPCNSRETTYHRHTLKTHFESKMHQRWINMLNNNKHNFYLQNISLRTENRNLTLQVAEKDKLLTQAIHRETLLKELLLEKNLPQPHLD